MLSKALIKRISSYKESKYRNQDKVFVVEGVKVVNELLNSCFEIETICALRQWLDDNSKSIINKTNNIIEVSGDELKKISSFSTPNQVLAVVKTPSPKEVVFKDKLVIALDQINDPGNLGTIIRIAHWFGIEDIICSENTVDQFNPKTIQSTMGSLFRVNVSYHNLKSYLQNLPKDYPIYGAVVENGENIYEKQVQKHGIIIIGSESHGISNEILPLINNPITIPNFSINQKAESLNASIATGIIVSEFKRRG
ncbi:MAG: RNA methyltransferase [Bacteroidales bacterium]|jgi:TrmH family RNA methyltransferase|nr:RNA methyltransferase [Bacteroidales bacterium]MDD4739408.1 RNA methyltransferase [Bacteroidales bacterium]MDY4789377.1 RNA methyltransferase [Bacteroidales bacterium]